MLVICIRTHVRCLLRRFLLLNADKPKFKRNGSLLTSRAMENMTDFEATDGVGLSRVGTIPKHTEIQFFGDNSAFNNVSRKPTGQLFTCQRKTMPGHTLTLNNLIKSGFFFYFENYVRKRIDMRNLILIFSDRCCV